MGWAGLTLVTDQLIGQLEPEATAPSAPWGTTIWTSARAEAKRDLKIWLEMDFPEVPGVADRVLDAWAPDYVFGYTGGAYAEVSAEADSDDPADVALASIFATANTDRLYIGAAWTFDGLKAVLTGTRNAVASTLTVKYSGPAGWTTLTASDGTAVSGATFGKSGRVTWTAPTDWQRERFNGTGDEYYWIELSVSAALTSGVTAAQVLTIRPPDGLTRCAQYLSLGHIYNGLAAQSPGEERWRQQADKYFTMAKDLYVGLKAKAGLWIDLDTSGTITAPEVVHQKGGHVFYRA